MSTEKSKNVSFQIKPNPKNQKKTASKKVWHSVLTRQPREVSHQHILQLWAKERETRNMSDIKILSEYLSSKYKYFTQLRDAGEFDKLSNLVKVWNLENFPPETAIIRFGEEGDKFYVLLDGTVQLFKIVYNQVRMSLRDYIKYLNDVQYSKGGNWIYERVLEKNAFLELDMKLILSIPIESSYLNMKYDIFVEGMELIGEFGDGFAFGDIALLRRAKRNATIIAKTKSQLVSIDKLDYNRIIRQLSEKKWENTLKEFQKTYNIFEKWTIGHLIKLFNYFSIVDLISGDYWYRQNEESKYIYMIVKGKFELYSLVSWGWVEKFLNYIVYAKSNILQFLDMQKQLKEQELLKKFNWASKFIIQSPCTSNPLPISNIITSIPHESNILDWELEKDKVMNPYTLFKVKVRNLEAGDVLGWEDALELKNRFYFARCTSPTAEVKRISVMDFYRVMNYQPNDRNKRIILDVIAEKKANWYKQIRKAVTKRSIGYEAWFEKKFDMIINSACSNEDINKSSVIKKKKVMIGLKFKQDYSNSKKCKMLIEEKPFKKYYETFQNCKINARTANIKVWKKGVYSRGGTHERKDNTRNNNAFKCVPSLPSVLKTKEKDDIKENEDNNKEIDLFSKRESLVISNNHSTRNNTRDWFQCNALKLPSFLQHQSSLFTPMKTHSSLWNYQNNKPQTQANRKSSCFSYISVNNSNNLSNIDTTKQKETPVLQNDKDEPWFDGKEYHKSMRKNNSLLTSEIYRLTGMKRIVPKKEITYEVYDDKDEQILFIESEIRPRRIWKTESDWAVIVKRERNKEASNLINNTKSSLLINMNKSSNKSLGESSKKTPHYASKSVLLRIRMKNYVGLRRRVKL